MTTPENQEARIRTDANLRSASRFALLSVVLNFAIVATATWLLLPTLTMLAQQNRDDSAKDIERATELQELILTNKRAIDDNRANILKNRENIEKNEDAIRSTLKLLGQGKGDPK